MNSDVKILIVEDEYIVAEYVQQGLGKLGYSRFVTTGTAAEAEKKIRTFKPDIIILDISLEKKYSGINLARIADRKYRIPVIFITGATDNRTVSLIEKSNTYGVLFKPFKIITLRIVLRMALDKSRLQKKIIRYSKVLETRFREINSFLEVSKLIEKAEGIEDIFNNALRIIPSAFKYGDRIHLRITYNGRSYETEDFKETKWVLTEEIVKKQRNKNLVELYLDISENAPGFPFTLTEIETFSSVVKQLAVIVEKYEGDFAIKQQLENQKLSSAVMEKVISNFSLTVHDLTSFFLKKMNEILTIPNACIISIIENGHLIKKYSLHKSKNTIPDKVILQIIEYVKKHKSEVLCFSKKNGSSCVSLESAGMEHIIAVPSRIGTNLVGIIILDFGEYPDAAEFVYDYILFGKLYALGIRKINWVKKITVYRQAIEQNPAAVVITDLEAKIVYVNPAFTRVTGYDYQEAIGQNPRILKSGSQDESFYKELWATLTNGQIWRGTFHNRKKSGELFWELSSISPIKNDDNEITGYIAVKEDITEKVETENKIVALNEKLKKTQSSLVMEEKLASIGRLAAGVAHELNNPIGFIYSNFRTIKKYFEKYMSFIDELKAGGKIPVDYLDNLIDKNMLGIINEDMTALLEESKEGFERVINIINSLKSFSRIDQLKTRVRYNFNDALITTLTVARNQIKYIADIKKEFGDIPDIYCNSSEINQVLLNIIVNAAQAIESGTKEGKGVITIKTYKEDGWVCCRISDTGPGIPEEILNNIFEPFFTTKPVGAGTGLGLNISYDIIVNKHNGELTAGNCDGGGAYFLIKLPANGGDESDET